MNEVLVREIAQPAPAQVAITPMHMLQVAIEKGASLEQLEKLMELQERHEANEARKAFVSAMSAFKANPPDIFKNKHVSFTTQKGKTEYDHATLDQVSLAIGTALSKHGLSHRWVTDQSDGRIKVTCIITHSMGHSESVSLQSSADDSGGKNSIQAIGSAVTYLQRYTLLAATGMAVQDQDDDGGRVDKNTLSDDAFMDFKSRIEATLTKDKAKAVWQEAVKRCQEIGDLESAGRLKDVMLKHATFIDSAKAREMA
jgi:hypothetical protein